VAPASALPASLLATLLARCTFAPPGTAVRCALSGGPDSAALVALAVAADLRVEAVHIDHGLRPNSAADAEIAATTARHFGIDFHCERIVLDHGPNLEARARLARRRVMGSDALTGHTADDQAETLLINLLRGSGSTGLAAMRPGPGKPILALRRTDTHQLCELLGVDVAIDATNADPRFRRNRVRNEVLPLLDDVATRDVALLLTRTSDLLRDDDDFLGELAAEIDPTDARAIAAAPAPLARRALRQWIIDTIDSGPQDVALNQPGAVGQQRHAPDLATVERIMAVARGAATGCDVRAGWRVERSHQRLRLFSPSPPSR